MYRCRNYLKNKIFYEKYLALICMVLIFTTSCAVKLNTPSRETASDLPGLKSGNDNNSLTGPVVTNVTATNANGAYITGETLVVQVAFNEAVIVDISDGTPVIELEMGTVDRNAVYTAGSGSTVLNFEYTLVAGDLNSDLDYTSTTALSLNSGSIKNTQGVNADLTLPAVGALGSLSRNKNIVICAGATAYDALGDGSLSSPYLICTAEQFTNIGANSTSWSSGFSILRDIDLVDYTEAADGTQWVPIGTSTIPFSGSINGNNHTVSNLSYSAAGTDYLGVFSYTDNAHIKNLNLSNFNITGRHYIGGLIGRADNSTLIDIHFSGTINASSRGGGLVGTSAYLFIYSSSVDITLNTGYKSGGLVGEPTGGVIANSYSKGTITGTFEVAGISGTGNRLRVYNVYSSATLSGTSHSIGGIVGALGTSSTIVGSFFAGPSITGVDSGDTRIGFLIGTGNTASVTNSHYLNTSTCNNTASGGDTCHDSSSFASSQVSGFFENNLGGALFSSWANANTWIAGSPYPLISVNYLNESAWGDCGDHLAEIPFAGGDGSATNPYLICSGAQFKNLADDSNYWLNTNFKLMDHIDLSAYSGTALTPIHFVGGVFDGNGKAINNYSFNSGAASISSVGLFGNVSSSVIRRVGVVNASVINTGGGTFTGILLGQLNYGTLVVDTYSSGTVSGGNQVGGLIGRAEWVGFLKSSYSVANVSGSTYVGGLIGFTNSNIRYSFSLGSVTASTSDAGRIIGGGAGSGNATNYFNSDSVCTGCDQADTDGTAVSVVTNPDWFYYLTAGANNLPFHDSTTSFWNFNAYWEQDPVNYPELR